MVMYKFFNDQQHYQLITADNKLSNIYQMFGIICLQWSTV